MSKSRIKATPNNPLTIPMSSGFFTDMPADCIRSIGFASPIVDAAALAMTSKQHYKVMRRTTTQRYLQSMAVADVVINDSGTFCLTQGGQVFVAGDNNHANLGLGDAVLRERFEQMPSFGSVKQVVGIGPYYNSFVTNAGEVFFAGGICPYSNGHSTDFIKSSATPRRAAFGGKVIKLANINGNICMLTNAGKVYVAGSGWPNFGVGVASTSRPVPIKAIPAMRDLTYHDNELYLLTRNNLLYACGSNTYGQLGQGDRMHRSRPLQVPLIENVKSIKVYGERVYALTHQGQVYAWGNNDDGMLGFGDGDEHNSPALLTNLSDIVEMEINDNQFFVTATGNVYVFGRNAQGELGLGDTNPRAKPLLNPVLQHIRHVKSDYRTACFTTNQNQVYVSGKVPSTRFSWQIKLEPYLMTFHSRIEQVARGHSTIIWRTCDGIIYVAGSNYSGQLGINSEFSRQPKKVLFPAVANIIREASVADLLFYSQSEGGYSLYCYQQAIKKIKQATTERELTNILREVNSTAWNNCGEINAILPAYHLVLRYANNPANQQRAWSVITAWARLLLMYRHFEQTSASNPQPLRDFVEMLDNLSLPEYSVGLFQPPVKRRAGHELLAQLQAEPAALRIAAGFLVDQLPANEPVNVLKRKAEDEPEGDQPALKKNKTKT